MRDPQFNRHMISKRVAVKALEEINKALEDRNHSYFWGYNCGDAGEYDNAVYSMAREIQSLVKEVKEYRALKEVLRIALSTPWNKF